MYTYLLMNILPLKQSEFRRCSHKKMSKLKFFHFKAFKDVRIIVSVDYLFTLFNTCQSDFLQHFGTDGESL